MPKALSFTPAANGTIQVKLSDGSSTLTTAEQAKLQYGYTAPAPVQQTTTGMRTTAAQNSATLANKIATIAPPPTVTTNQNTQQTTTGNTQTPAPAPGLSTLPQKSASGATVVSDTDNGDGTHTVSYADGSTDRVKVTGNQDGSNSYAVLTPEAGIAYDRDQAVSAAKDKAQTQTNYATTTLDNLKKISDATTQALIESIKQTYAARIDAMNDSNSRVLAAKTSEGIRSGRARYASGLQEGILSDEEQQGISRVGQLQGEMLTLIQQAQSAQNENDLKLFNERMDDLDKIDKNLQSTVQNLQKNATDQLTLLQNKAKAEADAAKAAQQAALDKSKRAAPGIAEQLNALPDAKSKAAFLQEYSDQSGIPLDVLMGDIQSYNNDQAKDALTAQKTKLDMQNIESEIAARNKDKSKPDSSTTAANNIINGVTSLGDVDAKDLEAVKSILQNKGFYNSTPPSWYVQAQNDIAKQDLLPEKLQAMWDEYRKKAIGEVEGK